MPPLSQNPKTALATTNALVHVYGMKHLSLVILMALAPLSWGEDVDFDARAIKAAATDLKTLMMALDVYRLDNFHYPSTEQGLAALVWKPVGLQCRKIGTKRVI